MLNFERAILHLGYLFALIYIALMWKMVPRLWEYQVEFPVRTTAHIILGFTIGFLLLIKIAIMRFFRHFEEWMPVLGTAITPDLQKATKQKREEELARDEAMDQAMEEEVAAMPVTPPPTTPVPTTPTPPPAKPAAPAVDLAKAKQVYEEVCSQCHDLSDVDAAPPKTTAQSRAMIARMIKENDAELSKAQNKLIAAWLDAHFVNKTN